MHRYFPLLGQMPLPVKSLHSFFKLSVIFLDGSGFENIQDTDISIVPTVFSWILYAASHGPAFYRVVSSLILPFKNTTILQGRRPAVFCSAV